MAVKNRRSRLQHLNARIAVLTLYAAGNDLAFSRANAQREAQEGRVPQFPTITQAEAHIKSIPRATREKLTREVYAEIHAAYDKLERERKALRSTDLPSQQKTESKSRKQAKRDAKTAERAKTS